MTLRKDANNGKLKLLLEFIGRVQELDVTIPMFVTQSGIMDKFIDGKVLMVVTPYGTKWIDAIPEEHPVWKSGLT